MAASLVQAGLMAKANDDAKAGLRCLEKATELDPSYADAHYHKANLLHRMLRWNAAFAAYQSSDHGWFNILYKPVLFDIGVIGDSRRHHALGTIERSNWIRCTSRQ